MQRYGRPRIDERFDADEFTVEKMRADLEVECRLWRGNQMHDAISAFETLLREHPGRTLALCCRKQIVWMTIGSVSRTPSHPSGMRSDAHVDEMVDDKMLDRLGDDGDASFGGAIGDRRAAGQ